MSTFTTTPSTTLPAYEIQVRIKDLLETRHERGEDSTAIAIFNTFRSAADHYYVFASGRAYVIGLSAWGEAYRADVEHCVNYVIAFNQEDWNDAYEALYAKITNIMRDHLIASRQRKLSLLRAA
jgi:hypothetical protein